MVGLNLKEVWAKLNSFAPLSLAASWDNVGLLVEPTGNHFILLKSCTVYTVQ
jgi:putative NIF3 family GTP cyclohydrolase 1 type 2